MGPLAQSCLSLCCSRKTSISYDPYAIVSSLSWEDSGPGWWLFFSPIMEMNHWVVLIKSSLSFNHRGITDKGGFLGHWVLPASLDPPTYHSVISGSLSTPFSVSHVLLLTTAVSPDSVTCRHAVILDCLHHLSPRQWFILIPQGEVCLLGFPHFAQTIPEGYFAPAPEARPGDMKVWKTQFLRAQASLYNDFFHFFLLLPTCCCPELFSGPAPGLPGKYGPPMCRESASSASSSSGILCPHTGSLQTPPRRSTSVPAYLCPARPHI